MSNRLQASFDATGRTNLYVRLFNKNNMAQAVNSSGSLVTFSSGTFAATALALTELFAGAYEYGVAVPSGTPAGVYVVRYYAPPLVGGSPALGDELFYTDDQFEWDGTGVVTAASLAAVLNQLHFTVPNQVDANALTGGGGGGGSDPLSSQVPGSYAQGSAGWALGQLASGQVTTVAPVSQSGDLTLIRGDSYTAARGRALDWTNSDGDWPGLGEAEITLEFVGESVVVSGNVLNPGASFQTVRVQPTSADTLSLEVGEYEFCVVATFAGTGTASARDDRATLLRGKALIQARE